VKCTQNENGRAVQEFKIDQRSSNIAGFLSRQQASCPVTVQTIGTWYWIIDEIEQAGMQPRLVRA
jgi:hypothetical protein